MIRVFSYLLLIIFLMSCATVNRINKYEIGYNDNEKEYIVYILGNFKDCKSIKIVVAKEEKVYYENEQRGFSESIKVQIPLNKLDTGLHSLAIYCNDKVLERKIDLWNFSFPVLRYIFTDSFYTDIINATTQDLIASDLFISELKNFSTFNEKNFIKSAVILQFLPAKDRQKLLIELAKKFNSEDANRIFYEYLKNDLFEPSSLGLIDVLFSRKDYKVDSNLFNIIITLPEERFFDKYFNLFLEREHLKNALVEFIKQDKESSFSKKVLEYVKSEILKGNLKKNNFVYHISMNYFYINPIEREFYLKLLKNKYRWEEGIFLLEINDIDKDFAEKILSDWEYFNLDVKKYLVRRLEGHIADYDLFFDKISKEEDLFFAEYATKSINRLKNQNDIKIKDYIKKMLERNYLDNYIISYVNGVNDNDFKKESLKKIYEMNGDFNRLVDIKDIDREYFVKNLENLLKRNDDLYYLAVGELVLLGEEYFDKIIKDYNEKKVDKNRMLAAFTAGNEKWGWFVYNELAKKNYSEEDKFIFKNLALYAKGELKNRIIEDLKNLEKDKFIAISLGIEDGRYNIDCKKVLGNLLDIKKDYEEIIRIGWMWAYCCPNDYLTYFNYAISTGKEEVIVNAMEGIIDIIDILKVDIKDKVAKPLKEAYEKFNSKRIRETFFNVYQYIGQKSDLEELEKLAEKIVGDEKNQVIHYIDLLKERIDKEGVK